MNNLSEFTIDDLREMAYQPSNTDLVRALSRELLALREAQSKPVAYADPQSFDNFKSMGGKNAACTKEWMWRDPTDGLVPLYAAPPLPTSNINHQSNIHSSTGAGSVAEIKQPSSMLTTVPDGWLMVPKEPTAAMYNAGDRELTTKQVWDAMLSVVPQLADTDSTNSQHESLSK